MHGKFFHKVEENSTVTLTAEPEKGYEVDSWSIEGSCNKPTDLTTSSIELGSVAGNITATVTFKTKTYTVVAKASDPQTDRSKKITVKSSGMEDQTGNTSAQLGVAKGSTVTLIAEPKNGYSVRSWKIDNRENCTVPADLTTDEIVLENVTGPIIATVAFKSTDTGAGTADENVEVNLGQAVFVNPDNPEDGFCFPKPEVELTGSASAVTISVPDGATVTSGGQKINNTLKVNDLDKQTLVLIGRNSGTEIIQMSESMGITGR